MHVRSRTDAAEYKCENVHQDRISDMRLLHGQLTLCVACAGCEQHRSPSEISSFASPAHGSYDTNVIELAYVAISDQLRTRRILLDNFTSFHS